MKFFGLSGLGILAACCLGLSSVSAAAQSASAPWLQQVKTLVRANFSYPRSAQIRGDQGQAVINVDMAPDGNITAVTLAQSSGSPILDREAVRIAQKIGRLPAPPSGTRRVTLPITWRLETN